MSNANPIFIPGEYAAPNFANEIFTSMLSVPSSGGLFASQPGLLCVHKDLPFRS
jgi:hypothetical protein